MGRFLPHEAAQFGGPARLLAGGQQRDALAHRVDEELLAHGEAHGQRVEVVGAKRIAAVPERVEAARESRRAGAAPAGGMRRAGRGRGRRDGGQVGHQRVRAVGMRRQQSVGARRETVYSHLRGRGAAHRLRYSGLPWPIHDLARTPPCARRLRRRARCARSTPSSRPRLGSWRARARPASRPTTWPSARATHRHALPVLPEQGGHHRRDGAPPARARDARARRPARSRRARRVQRRGGAARATSAA